LIATSAAEVMNLPHRSAAAKSRTGSSKFTVE
jgi:hypothetical protein